VIDLRENRFLEAEQKLMESFQINAKQNLALANLIPVYLKLKESKKAVAFGEEAIKAMPGKEAVVLNYAAALMQEQEFRKAYDILYPLLDEEKPKKNVLSGLAGCAKSLFQNDELEKFLKLAEKHFPDDEELNRLKADTSSDADPLAALSYFQATLAKNPKSIATKWNMSLVQLRLGQFEEGWVNYENGLLPEVGKIGRPIPQFFDPEKRVTQKDDLNPDMWTTVVCEQGIGDQVLFLGCLNEFVEEFPKTILVSEKRLRNVYSRSFDSITHLGYGFGPSITHQPTLSNGFIPLGSIQKFYRKSEDDYRRAYKPYLSPKTKIVEKYRATLTEVADGRRIVGFSWKGGFWERAQQTKSLSIEHWHPIFSNDDTLFVSLQYGDTQVDKQLVRDKGYSNVRWIDGVNFKTDIESWFALMAACDSIISVSTALVHFAGAYGMPVTLLLSDRGAPFIWGLEHDESFAYPSIKIVRKGINEEFNDFFGRAEQVWRGQGNGSSI